MVLMIPSLPADTWWFLNFSFNLRFQIVAMKLLSWLMPILLAMMAPSNHSWMTQDCLDDYLPDQPLCTYQCGRMKTDHIWGTPGVLTLMLNAGVLPFGTEPNSDHAILYIDLLFDTLTGISLQSLYDPTHPPGFHNLWSTDIKAAKKYVTLVNQGFLAENIHECVAILVSWCQHMGKCTANNECILNKISEMITWVLLSTEAKCKKARGHAWSPILATAGKAIIAAEWPLSYILNGCLCIHLFDKAWAIIHAKKQLKEAYAILY